MNCRLLAAVLLANVNQSCFSRVNTTVCMVVGHALLARELHNVSIWISVDLNYPVQAVRRGMQTMAHLSTYPGHMLHFLEALTRLASVECRRGGLRPRTSSHFVLVPRRLPRHGQLVFGSLGQLPCLR